MATNALAEDPAAVGVLPEAWLAEVAGAELAEPAALLLLDPELLQAASRPARAVSPAVQASCLTRPGFRPRSTRSIRPMTFRLSRVPTLSGEIVGAVEGQQPPGHHRVGELAGDLGPVEEKPGEDRPGEQCVLLGRGLTACRREQLVERGQAIGADPLRAWALSGSTSARAVTA